MASQRAFPHPELVDTVVVAKDGDYPDALTASSLAGVVGSPILLSPSTSLDTYTQEELERLKPSTVYIVGGEASLNSNVEAQINAISSHPDVKRLGGTDRYDAGNNIARAAYGLMDTKPTEVFLTTGDNFPDALAISPFAVSLNIPVLITQSKQTSEGVISFIQDYNIDTVTIVGGPNSVSTDTENYLRDTLGLNVERIGGADRYEAASNVVRELLDRYSLSPSLIGVTTGDKFPDALSGGASLGARGGIMILTPTSSLHASAKRALDLVKATRPAIEILGGPKPLKKPLILSLCANTLRLSASVCKSR
jgi:putative cell wall-binding protein